MPNQPGASLSELARSPNKADNSLVNSAQCAAPPTQTPHIGQFCFSAEHARALNMIQNLPNNNNPSRIEELVRLLNALATIEQARPSPSAASPTNTSLSEDPESDTENSCDGVSEIEGPHFTGPITDSTIDASQYVSVEDLYMNIESPSKILEEAVQSTRRRRRVKIKAATFNGAISGKSVVNGRQIASNGNLYLRLDK